MRFHEKIHLLMKMSNTTNARLAAALGIDPSLVSRWRTGSRTPGNGSRYMRMMGVYFASQAKQDFQRVALLELTGHSDEDKNASETVIAGNLSRWLSNESEISMESVRMLLDTIGSAGNTASVQPCSAILPDEPVGQPIFNQTFLGDKGIQASCVKLLLCASRTGAGGTLLLYSDEPMTWITQDRGFASMWTSLLFLCIEKGVRIQIIHTLSRDSEELVAAVQSWLPFYLTGAITSYYYPSQRDGLFHHTCFTLAGVATVFSQSTKGQERSSVHYLYATEKDAVNSAERSFQALLMHSKSLVRTLTGGDVSDFMAQQAAFLGAPVGSGAAMQSVPLSGMPTALLERMLERIEVPDDERASILTLHREREKAQEKHLKNQNFSMVICLPRLNDAIKGNVAAVVPGLLAQRECRYQPRELLEHLRHTIRLLEKYERLQLFIIPRKHILRQVQIFAKQETGMIVLKHTEPRFVFISEQLDLVSALYSYITLEISKIPKRERNKSFVIGKLGAYMQKLSAALEER